MEQRPVVVVPARQFCAKQALILLLLNKLKGASCRAGAAIPSTAPVYYFYITDTCIFLFTIKVGQ